MEDKNKWILIGLQLFHVILFLVIAILFGVYAFQDMNGCYFPCMGPHGDCHSAHCSCEYPQEYNVKARFKGVFITGFVTYLLDAICRFIIVIGLYFGRIYVQFTGVFGTVVVSTFA